MRVGGLADHPVGVAAQGPAGDGADQGLLVAQTLDEVGDELRQVRDHALHTAWRQKQLYKSSKRWPLFPDKHLIRFLAWIQDSISLSYTQRLQRS